MVGWMPLITVVSPLLMTYLLVLSGARLIEKYLKNRPRYAEYQRRTTYFTPHRTTRPPKAPPR
jgi:steroid 5-alpha reductase family enzyme